LYLFLVVPFVIPAGLGIISSKTLKRIFLSFLFTTKTEDIPRIAEDFVEKSVMPRIYPEVRAMLEKHKSENAITVLNTAAPDLYANIIGEKPGVDHIYATRVRMDSQRMPLFPKIEGKNNKRLEKIRRMYEILPVD